MKQYARIYSFYNNIWLKILRMGIFVWLLGLMYFSLSFNFSLTTATKVPLAFLSIFLMWEVFFHFKILRTTPILLAKDNDGKNIYDSFTLQALSIVIDSSNSISMIKTLFHTPQIKFIMQKGDFSEKNITLIEISKDSLVNLAFQNCKNIQGKYVTTMDLFVAYLLLTEDQTKMLFNRALKKDDLISILYWAKSTYVQEENIDSLNIKFWGEGIGEGWVTGWTLETKKHMSDITKEALANKPLLLGREEQYKEVVEALSKNKSVLLVGEPGTGKNALVKSLAFESFVGNLKGNLHHQRFFQILVDSLLAGIQNQGQLEERINNILAEISHSGNIITYIPNFESILGSSSFNTDLSGALIPYLEKGAIKIIASITPGSYGKFVEQKHTLTSALEIVKFEEPDKDSVFKMLLKKTPEIEKTNKISISFKAIVASQNYANKYLQDRMMPGAGISLLEDSASATALAGKKIVLEQDVINKVESKTKIAIGVPKEKERNLLLHMEDELSKYIVGQKDAIFEVSEALRRIRAGLASKKKPISFLFLGPTGVGKTQAAKALANIYFGGEDKIIRFDMSEYSTEEGVSRLLGGVVGTKSLTEEIHERPFSLVLLDEFEKAHPKIIDLFLQVLDDGRLTNSIGKTVSFADAIVIATSNAASEYIREEVSRNVSIDGNFQKKILELLQQKGIFRPELLNRFDGIIVFKPLKAEETYKIVQMMLAEFSKKLLEQDITAKFDEKVIEKITKEGFNEQFGARPLSRYIQTNIADIIAQKILKEEIKRGDKISMYLDFSNNLKLSVNS
ncbi:MAG: ATP-dependent Clp protease ATP-binding subunit [Candidatus Levybacteria bacterium]|nr:ATP-dependent Clp protease ATP-binding subunit [Candidatus Levybacteria bacterium]MDZ4228071.1 ATP-dependent Clp protease ATP-binding subunit [Candidatus Levybacteria bacterium]